MTTNLPAPRISDDKNLFKHDGPRLTCLGRFTRPLNLSLIRQLNTVAMLDLATGQYTGAYVITAAAVYNEHAYKRAWRGGMTGVNPPGILSDINSRLLVGYDLTHRRHIATVLTQYCSDGCRCEADVRRKYQTLLLPRRITDAALSELMPDQRGQLPVEFEERDAVLAGLPPAGRERFDLIRHRIISDINAEQQLALGIVRKLQTLWRRFADIRLIELR